MTRRRVVAGLGMLLLPGPPASAAESTGAGKSLMLHAAGHARRLEAGSRQIAAPGLATEGGEGVPVFNAGDRVEEDAEREVVGVADAHGFRIVSGVDAGARIVTAGVNTLVEGQKVRIDKDDRP